MMNFPIAALTIICFHKVLKIQITKRPDGSGLLRCVRADGSITWQKQERNAAFFALHDLTHFAVESTLGFRRGFYGLIAEGWNVEDFSGKGARGPLPDEAVEVEYLVGSLDAERAGGDTWRADEFNHHVAMYAGISGREKPRVLTDEALGRVRAQRDELFGEWFALGPGGTLDLSYEIVRS
jgi:hypothetical protein